MIQTSQAFADAVEGNARQHRARFLLDGTPVDGAIKSVTVQKGSCGENAFPLGAVYSTGLTAQIDRCTQDLENAELEFQVGLLLADGSTEYVTVCIITVTEVRRSAFTTSITGIGRIGSKCGVLYVSSVTFPASIGAVLDDLRTQTGCSINADAFSNMLELTIRNAPENMLCRDVLKLLAELFGGFVTESNTGTIVFAKFTALPAAVMSADRTTGQFAFAGNDFTVTGVRIVTAEDSDESGETGTVFETGQPNLQLTNPYMTQEIFDAMAANIVGYQYRPAEIPVSMGDIRLEAFDALQVRNTDGTAYTIPCMSVVHTYDGGVNTLVTAPGDSESAQQSETKGMLQQAVERLVVNMLSVKKLVAEKADIDLANIDTANIAQAFIDAVFAKDVTATGTISGAVLEGAKLIGKDIQISADMSSSDAASVLTIVETGQISAAGTIYDPATGEVTPVSNAGGSAAEAVSFAAEAASGTPGGSGEAESTMTESQALQRRYIRLYAGNSNSYTDMLLLPRGVVIRGEKDVEVSGSVVGAGAKAPVVLPAMTVRSDTNQTLTSVDPTTVQLGHVRWATPGTDKYLTLTEYGIRCEVAGYVEVSGKVFFESGYTAGQHLRAALYQNDTYLFSASEHPPTTAKYQSISLHPVVMQVAAGDMIYLKAIGANGCILGRTVGAQHTSTLTIKYIG